MTNLLNYKFYAVDFNYNNEQEPRIVPKSWIIFDSNENEYLKFPFVAYTYYSMESYCDDDTYILPTEMLNQFKSDFYQEKVEGCVYKAKIIDGFGKHTFFVLKINHQLESNSTQFYGS